MASHAHAQLYTIGFTGKTAERFFTLLGQHGITALVDVRLRPDSQLSGFAKARDLPYFLRDLIGCDYRHIPLMAPTGELLDRYRKDKSWAEYERDFISLLYERNLIDHLDRVWWSDQRACLLCSEHEPDHCHRRLVAEYITRHWPEIQIHHLK